MTGECFAPVIYKTDRQNMIIAEFFQILDAYLLRYKRDLTPEEFTAVRSKYFTNFNNIAAFFKHPSFEEEREWRYVNLRGETPVLRCKQGHIVT